MFVRLRQYPRLSLSAKFSRLTVRLRDPEWRRYGKLLCTGKAIGIGLVLLIVLILFLMGKI